MEEASIASLTLRVNRLERECRRWRWLGASAALCTALLLCIGGARSQDPAPPAPPNGVTALDKERRARAVLDVLGDGTPYLAFYDAKGLCRLRLYLSQDGSPVLGCFDKHGGERLTLGLSRESPVLTMFDQGGQERVSISAATGGPDGLSVKDREERSRLILEVGADNSASVRLNGEDGKPRFAIANGTGGRVGLNAWDVGGKYRVGLGITPNGESDLTLIGADGRPLLRVPPQAAD
jgi:hypothetical protein